MVRAKEVASLGFAVALVMIGAWSCSKDSSGPERDPDIEVSPSSLEFEVQAGGVTGKALTIKNEGDADLSVTSITSDVAWLSVSLTSCGVSAGSSRSMTVNVDASGMAPGGYGGTITMVSNDPDEQTLTVGVTLTVIEGEEAPDIDITPTVLSFSVPRDSIECKTLTVTNVGDDTLNVTITVDVTWLSVSPISFSLAPGESQDLEVCVDSSGLSPGSHTAAMMIHSNDPDEPEVEEGITLTVEGPLGGELIWCFQTVNVLSSPAVGADGTIYIGSLNGLVHALNSAGHPIWHYYISYVVSSPAIGADGSIYIGSWDNADLDENYIYALNPNGTMEWRYLTGLVVTSSPAIGSDETIYAGSWDHCLYALTPEGELKWRYQTEYEVHASPAVGVDGTIYFGSCDNYIYALDPNGGQKWRFETDGDVRSSPAIGSDGTIYIGSNDGYVYALDPNGGQKWRFETDGDVRSSPAIGSDGTIYIGSNDGYVYALDPNGGLKWRFETNGGVESSPTVGSDGTIYIGSNDGNIYAIDHGGAFMWRYETGGVVKSSPAIGSDGSIYVGSYDGYIYAITSSSTGLAVSSWPKFQHDNMNTGRADD